MKTVNITYFVHSTTTDNEKGISTGWLTGELSELGRRQCVELRELIKERDFDIVFCSDLKRAVDSAERVFGKRGIPIIQDSRLRECNYGDLNGTDSKRMNSMVLDFIETPFPNGESFRDVERRVRSLLKELMEKYPGKNVAIVSHRFPQIALDVILKGKSWEQAIKEHWGSKEPKEWKPGWDYQLRE